MQMNLSTFYYKWNLGITRRYITNYTSFLISYNVAFNDLQTAVVTLFSRFSVISKIPIDSPPTRTDSVVFLVVFLS